MSSWKMLLPDYTFMLWDCSRFEVNSIPWTKQAFEAKKYAFVSDYIRLYALHKYGGIYLDTDVEVIKSFDPLLKLPYFIGIEQDRIIEAAVFGAEKGTPWLKECMGYYEDKSFVFDERDFTPIIIPNIMESVLEKTRKLEILSMEKVKKIDQIITNPKTFVLFPFDFFSAKNNETHEIKATNNTYTIHHFNNYWVPKRKKIRSKLKRKLFKLLGINATDRLIHYIGFRKVKRILKHEKGK